MAQYRVTRVKTGPASTGPSNTRIEVTSVNTTSGATHTDVLEPATVDIDAPGAIQTLFAAENPDIDWNI
jgi:hypothetical protein